MKNRPLFIAVSALVLGGLTFWLAQHFAGNYLDSHAEANTAKAASCETTRAERTLTIANNTIAPAHISAQLCDTITVTNKDAVERKIAFGTHDHHQAYDGVSEKVLQKDQSFTVTLVTTGSFIVHDHYHDEVSATFSVRE